MHLKEVGSRNLSSGMSVTQVKKKTDKTIFKEKHEVIMNDSTDFWEVV